MSTPEYYLSRHVHLCLTGDHVVFLDLRRDKYQAIGRAERCALRNHVAGWPSCGDLDCGHEARDSQALLTTLLDHGLLTTDPALGRVVELPTAEPPTNVLIDDELARQRSISRRQALRFALACAKVAILLRLFRLDRVVDSIARRKRKALARGESSTLERDRELVATFNRLRPFAFSANTFCLYDSLALLEFLAMYDSYPCWIVGVHTSPFAAHSWLQQHGYLFNGPIDQVARYTPILVV